jgi:hypothetical protein
MYQHLLDLAQQVTDERSFVRFLTALREDCENSSDNQCEVDFRRCGPDDWQTRSTAKFLHSMEDWAGGDFIEGRHHGDPLLQRIAIMLCVGRHLRPEDRHY